MVARRSRMGESEAWSAIVVPPSCVGEERPQMLTDRHAPCCGLADQLLRRNDRRHSGGDGEGPEACRDSFDFLRPHVRFRTSRRCAGLLRLGGKTRRPTDGGEPCGEPVTLVVAIVAVTVFATPPAPSIPHRRSRCSRSAAQERSASGGLLVRSAACAWRPIRHDERPLQTERAKRGARVGRAQVMHTFVTGFGRNFSHKATVSSSRSCISRGERCSSRDTGRAP